MTARERGLLIAGVFLLGILGGVAVGLVYGRNSADAQLAQRLADSEKRVATVNDNYLVLVQEYNKLFASRQAAAVAATSATPKTAPTAAPSGMAATPAPTAAPAMAVSGKPKAEFEGEAINGTAPREGPPPQRFRFKDLSTGNITSWEWSFGDGTVSLDQNPEHTYDSCPGEMGLCTVVLKVCGPEGCDIVTKENYLRVSQGCTGC
jgi:PKD repeat protein